MADVEETKAPFRDAMVDALERHDRAHPIRGLRQFIVDLCIVVTLIATFFLIYDESQKAEETRLNEAWASIEDYSTHLPPIRKDITYDNDHCPSTTLLPPPCGTSSKYC